MSRVQGNHLYLVDLLDRLLDQGVVIRGHLVITVADIELIYIDLSLLISSVDTAMRAGRRWSLAHEHRSGE
jgi:hypothetical protein